MPEAPIRKKLIEVSIPLEAINVASAREKSIRHGHPSTLHLWWARRPLAACRAVLFAQLVDDPSSWPERFGNDPERIDAERRRLHKVIEAMVPWEASNNETILNAARWEIARSVAWGLGEEPPARGDGPAILDYLQTKAPPVYDPFSGGGSIPLEAQRLGLRAYGSDLNPVAVLIGKALVEIPPKFAGRPPVNPQARAEAANGQLRAWKGAQGLAEDVRYYGQWMRDEAEKRIGHLYPKATLPDGSKATVIAWLWARTVRSPDPAAKGAMVPLVSSFMLSTKEGKKAWVDTVIDQDAPDGWRFEVQSGKLSKEAEAKLKEGTMNRSGGRCILTGTLIDYEHIRSESRAGRLPPRLMAIVAEGNRKRFYLSPNLEQEKAAALERPDGPDGTISHWPGRTNVVVYGMTTFESLFTSRQLTALTTLFGLISEMSALAFEHASIGQSEQDDTRLSAGGTGAHAYADALATYLAFAVDKGANYWSSVCAWNTGAEKLVSTFGRQSIPMVWDFTESNPFCSSSGNFSLGVTQTAKNVEALSHPAGRAEIFNIDAAKNSFPIRNVVISTDPPYYDNIGYADISDFFYVWLRKYIGNVWPDLFRRLSVPKEEELVAKPHLYGGRASAEARFMSGMSEALTAVFDVSTDDAPQAIYYAFKQSEIEREGTTSAGWASFLQAVVDSGFSVDGTWPMRMEYTTNLKSSMNVLASAVILVCRKRSQNAEVTTRADFTRALKREMPAAIEAIRKAGVGPVDMQQSVIGPGMGVFSRHAKVLEDDDTAMSVKTALTVINRVWEEIENELDQAFDAPTQVALAWFATYGFDAKPSGDLITLANAKNVPMGKLFSDGVFQDLRGRAALMPRGQLPRDWTPAKDTSLTVWECVQHTARVLNAEDGGGEQAAALVAQMGPRAEEARALAYRLFEISTQKGWAAEALIYNELAQEWPKLEDLATKIAKGEPIGAQLQPTLL